MAKAGRPDRLRLPLGSMERRRFLATAAASAFVGAGVRTAEEPVRFGLTPVFLTNDLELLVNVESYLKGRLNLPVELVQRRTYQEITALLISGQLDACPCRILDPD